MRGAVRVRPPVRDVEKASVSSSGGSAIHCQGNKLWMLDSGGELGR